MKFSTILSIAGTLMSVSAQGFGAEPACAIPCLQSAVSKAGCAANDEACACGTAQAAIQSDATPCIITACSGPDLAAAASIGLGLCAAWSATALTGSVTTEGATAVTVVTSINPGGVLSTTAATASETGSALSSINPGGVVSILTNTSVSGSGSASATGSALSSSLSSAVSSASSALSSASSVLSSASASASKTASTSAASSSAPVTANAAPTMGIQFVGGLMGAALGVAAIL